MTELVGIQVIISGAISKQPQEQRILVNHYSDYLYAIAIRYMGNTEDARDILQQSWIKGLEHLHQFDEKKGSFKSWMSKIVVNSCLYHFRHKKIKFVPLERSHNTLISQDESIIDRMSSDEILKIVSRLPDSYRQVFNMAVIDGYSHKEIGEVLNITELVSRTRLKRAKEKLKSTFSKLIHYKSWEKTV